MRLANDASSRKLWRQRLHVPWDDMARRHGRKRAIADEAGATLSGRVDDAQRDSGSFGARGRDVDGLGAEIGLEVGDRFVEMRSRAGRAIDVEQHGSRAMWPRPSILDDLRQRLTALAVHRIGVGRSVIVVCCFSMSGRASVTHMKANRGS